MHVGNLALVVANLPLTLLNDGLKLGDLVQQFLFALLASCTHVLLFLFDEAEKLVDAVLHLRAESFALLILVHSQLLHALLMFGPQLVLLVVEIALHVVLLNDVGFLHCCDVCLVLFDEAGDLGTELIHLVTGVGS